MRWLYEAADNLKLDVWLVQRRDSTDPDRRGSTDIGIGLRNETDYALLVDEFDRLTKADFDMSMADQAAWERRVAEYESMPPDCVNPELELDFLDHAAENNSRLIERDREDRDLSL